MTSDRIWRRRTQTWEVGCEHFKPHVQEAGLSPTLLCSVDFEALILTAGSWPFSGLNSSEFQLPTECEKSVSEFAKFYSDLHSGRKLTWLHNLSKADLRLNMPDKRYELNCSLYQAGVLLQFAETDSFTMDDLQAATALKEQELKRVIKALTDVKLLVQDETTVAFNGSFFK